MIRYRPARLRLVLAGRTPPPLSLARLRLQGGVVDLPGDRLRFSVPEAASLLSAGRGPDVVGPGGEGARPDRRVGRRARPRRGRRPPVRRGDRPPRRRSRGASARPRPICATRSWAGSPTATGRSSRTSACAPPSRRRSPPSSPGATTPSRRSSGSSARPLSSPSTPATGTSRCRRCCARGSTASSAPAARAPRPAARPGGRVVRGARSPGGGARPRPGVRRRRAPGPRWSAAGPCRCVLTGDREPLRRACAALAPAAVAPTRCCASCCRPWTAAWGRRPRWRCAAPRRRTRPSSARSAPSPTWRRPSPSPADPAASADTRRRAGTARPCRGVEHAGGGPRRRDPALRPPATAAGRSARWRRRPRGPPSLGHRPSRPAVRRAARRRRP